MRLLVFLSVLIVSCSCKQVEQTTDCTPPFRPLEEKNERISIQPEKIEAEELHELKQNP